MKSLIKYPAILFCLLLLPAKPVHAIPDLEILRKRVKEEMMKPSVSESLIKDLMEFLREDGTWPDIDYVDVSRTGFQHSEHLRNLVTLCRAFEKHGSKFKGNKKLQNIQ